MSVTIAPCPALTRPARSGDGELENAAAASFGLDQAIALDGLHLTIRPVQDAEFAAEDG